jgi:hypothetical protein
MSWVWSSNQPVLIDSITYENPTVFTKISRGIKGFLKGESLNLQKLFPKQQKAKVHEMFLSSL